MIEGSTEEFDLKSELPIFSLDFLDRIKPIYLREVYTDQQIDEVVILLARSATGLEPFRIISRTGDKERFQ